MSSTDENSSPDVSVREETEKGKKAPTRRQYILFAVFLSVATNILMLVSPLYMLQVYDRVLSSSSLSTLLSLSLIAAFLLGVYAFSEAGRRRALGAYGKQYTDAIGLIVARQSLARRAAPQADSNEPTLQDVTRVQSFLLSGGIIPILDLPFAPLFLGLMFLLHPLIGMVGLTGAALLIAMAILSERTTSGRMIADQADDKKAEQHLAGIVRSANAVNSMGMRHRLISRWHEAKSTAMDKTLSTSSLSGFLTGGTRSIRQILQIVILGTGAYLALKQEVSPGAIVAGSIVMGRGLAPIDQIVGSWRQISLARESWRKLRVLDPTETDADTFTPTQWVQGALACSEVAIAPPGIQEPLLAPFTLTAEPGKVYGIIGTSGSGKSTLLQTLAGLWQPQSGYIALAGRDIFQWNEEDRGRFVGYLPQRVELVPGTIRDNICRFTDAPVAEIDAAARLTGTHEAIASIPGVYDAVIGLEGMHASAGQQQSIGIARAFFGDPHVLLLDEPTANLDPKLVAGFIKALAAAKERGAIVIIATHDSRILPHLDFILTVKDRRIHQSRKEDVVNQLRSVPAQRGGAA